MKSMLTLFLVGLSSGLLAQVLYQIPSGVHSRVSSFENLNGVRGAGGMSNAMAKGHAFEALKAGETKTLLKVQAAGVLQRIWCTVSDRSPSMLRSLRLHMYWDGMDQAAVDVPLGDFFGAALKPVAFQSALMSDPEGRSFVCTIPMPFRKGAMVTLTNESLKDLELLFFDIDYVTMDHPDSDNLYFHACWTRTRNAPIGQDAVLLPEVVGRGRFLGVSVGVCVNPVYDSTWWGEGEFKAWLDGDSTYPTINGTGAEDYIGTGWGEGAFAHLYQGCLVADGGQHQYAIYRWHVPDAIYFEHSCRVAMQQIGGYFAGTVKRLQAKGVALKPVSLSGVKGFRGLFEKGQEHAGEMADAHDWMNFYRSDDYAATAYFYLDRPTSNLPALAAVQERCAGILP